MEESVQQFLQEAGLQEFAGALEGLGVQCIKDLEELEAEDFQEIGMKKLQKRRLERHLGERLERAPKRPRGAAAEPVAQVAQVAQVATPAVNTSAEFKGEEAARSDASSFPSTEMPPPSCPSHSENEMKSEVKEQTEVPSRPDDDGEWEMLGEDDLMQHVNSLGQEAPEAVMDIDHFPLASCNREATGAQLIGLQTDLQDDMHVAKLVTNIEEVVALCNIVRPKSASMVPKLKVNFQKLSEPSASFQVVALLGEQPDIRKFLDSLQVPQPTVDILKKEAPGLYALVHQQRLYLILWPASGGFRDHAQRRQLISFIHYVLQLASEVIWLVQQGDVDGVQSVGGSLRAADTSRNMDIQISMKSASEDDCTLGSPFQASLKWDFAAVKVFSGKQRASLGMMKVQPAGRYKQKDIQQETILNFFRNIKDTHVVHFDPALKLEDAAEFVKTVAPDKFKEIQERHIQAQNDALQQALAKENAIEESAQREREQVFRKLKGAIWDEFLQHHPREFFVLNACDTECVLCSQELGKMPCACLPCSPSHIFHRDCLKQCLKSRASPGQCPSCPLCRCEFPNRPVQDLLVDLTDKDAAHELARQLPTQVDHVLVGKWNATSQRWWRGLNYFVIMEDGRRDLLIKVSVDKIADGPDGVLHRGSGPGAGYWYAILKYPSNGQIFGTVRLRELGNDEVDIWHRPRGERIWGDPCKAAKDVALASRADTCSLGGAIKQAKLRLTNLSSMYMFAMVARSKKWFEAKGLPLADTMRQMLIESVQDPNAFNHWHRKLAPEQGFFERLRNYGSGDAGNVESVKKLMQDEYRRGILHEPNYTKTLQTYREQLLAKMDEALRQMSDQMFSRLKQHVISQKKAELQKDRADNEVELERHVRNDLSRAMQSLAPPNAMSIMLTRMVSRFSGNYRLHYEKEVEGCPKLFCKLEHLKVEKQLFEQVLAGEGDHLQVELEASGPEFALDVQDPDDVHLLGSLSKERVFWISSHEIPDGGKGVKFHCSARSQPTKELLNIKRPTSSVAFNETLRMLALYNQASKVVAVYVWDEAFTRHTDYCAPINLEAYVQDADLLQMHFLPASKQLCFVLRNNMVKVYELVAKTMRPRGFQIAPHAKTFVDSTGTALVVLRQESSKWMVDVILVADGRQVKTLALPLALQDEVPVVDILRLYGVDFLVALDSATKTLHGWRLHLQTAEQVCSMEQVGEKAVETTKCQSAGMACFDILYQVLAKFTNHPALGADLAQQMTRLIVVGPAMSSNPGPVVERYVADIIRRLRQDTQKPSLDGFNLDVSYWPVSSNEDAGDVVSNLQSSEMTMAQLLRKLICLVPLQIARAENESFVILKDGMREDVSDFSNLSELAEFISFGLYELVLESNENPVVVISSMGKQSTGKSYMLNHLAGTSFDTSGGRCTDGVWMTVREHSDITYVMLDFEGLGSFERSAQEDMLLSVFNAAISHVSLFRTENRLDCDTASIFSRMQQGAKLIQGDEELFNGFFQIVVKDVVSDAKEVAQEFRQKIQHIIARDKEDNFFLRLYKGRVGILPFPALGRAEFYREFNSLTSKVRAAQAEKRCFESGRQYLRNTKLLMAKIAMKDWTPTDQNKIKMLLASLQECLATAVMAGCMAVTEDGPVPLLHLRSNKTFLDKGSEGDEPEMNSILAAVPDEGLQLALVQEQDGALDVEVSCEIMASLLSKLKAAVNCSTATDWTPVLQALAQRRQKRIVAWLEANVEHVAGEGDAQRLLMVAKTVLARLLQKLRLCGQDCGMCRLPCTLPVDHSSSSHDCGTDHKCHAFCHYCASDGVAAACVQPAGHSAEHDCGDAAHTCGAECSLSNLGNCGGRCVLKPGHSEEQHLCGSKRHHCGKPCALSTCQHSCVLPHDLMHDRCECHIIVCPNKCTFPNCTFMCSEQDHFHTEGHSGDGCMCDQPHQCPHECEAPGICEIYSELVVKKQKFTGKHDTFDYDAIETEQNGVRKGCCKVVPPKSRQHEGEHIHSSTENLVHYCDVKCPTCGYYCTLPWEHSGEHDTRHGNMRRTYFVSDEDVFTLGSRKYAPAESGVAEMCNMYCHRAGRGHTHVKLCADYSSGQGGQCCISAMPGRRHSMRQYKPNPEIPKDEFTHEAFWESTGFKDPCSNEDKEVFGKCNHFCPHASHMKDGELPSFCTLPLWHAALSDQEGKEYVRQHGGIVSPDGHHFSCSHRTSLPVHTIFLIDKSGSMSYNDVVPETRPWRDSHPNRLGCALAAIQSFVEKRQHSSPDDKISLLAFDTDALNGPSMVSISDFDTCHQWLSNLEANYQTSFANAMAATIPLVQQTPNSHRSMVMFLSDGWDHFPAQALQRVFAAVARSTPGKALRLHTVQFPAQHGSDADVLAQMAQAARNHAAFDDEFAQASSSMQSVDNISLQETFMGIAESLSSAAGGLITAS